jgi:hypothetical protein
LLRVGVGLGVGCGFAEKLNNKKILIGSMLSI